MTWSYPSLPSTPAPSPPNRSPPRCSEMDVKQEDAETHDYVEVDPTGRYGRYNEILGKGASKIVYKAFDEYEGIEVAWNQVKIHDLLQRPEDLERLYSEIHLLKTLEHKNIMKFCTSWVDAPRRNINFVTELFTSGTLRQYRQQHKKVNVRAVKHWCRQILKGLLYLHSHDPPIIHRDLKCDNIFINGNQGVVKIGDLGLAAILRKSHYTHCVGTPEFMAPEVFEEEYNELIDIYSFGMCVLEMVTFEYPYSECSHPVQIYKKVMSGIKPAAFHKIKDPELKEFVEKCLASASERPSANELLQDPFLRADDPDSRYLERGIGSFITNEFAEYNADMSHGMREPSHSLLHGNGSLLSNNYADYQLHQARSENEWNSSFRDFEMKGIHLDSNEEDHSHSLNINPEMKGIHLFDEYENEPFRYVDITIKGMRREDGSLFFRLRIIDEEGHVRNIHFPFDMEEDTALTVATEMVGELDITDHDVTRIAEMIDAEVSSLMPELSPGLGSNALDLPTASFCNSHTSDDSSYDSLLEYLSVHAPGSANLQSTHCSGHEYTAVHGRFEETTYHVEESEQCVTEGAPPLSTSQSEFGSQGSGVSHSDGESNQLTVITNTEKETPAASQTGTREHAGDQLKSGSLNISDDSKRTHNELRFLMARDRQLSRRSSNSPPGLYNMRSSVDNCDTGSSADVPSQASSEKSKKSLRTGKRFSFFFPPRRNLISSNKSFADTDTENSKSSTSNSEAQRARNSPASNMENMITSKDFYSGFRLQGALL